MKKLLLMLLLGAPASAAIECTTLNLSAYTQDQLNLVPGLAYRLGYSQNPASSIPTISNVGKNVTICFLDPTFVVTNVITIANLTSQYQADEAARNAALAQWNAWKIELSTTSTALNNARVIGIDNLTAAQQRAVTQALLQWHWLRVQLRIDEL